MQKEKVLEVKNLKKYFPVNNKLFFGNSANVKAVDNVSLYINKGETLGLVGESGCGKSTLGKTVTGLYEPTEGEIYFKDKEVGTFTTKKKKKYLNKNMQMIFQDPSASLNPRKTIKNILLTPFKIHNIFSKKERLAKINNLMEIVGLSPYYLSRYPHELSGGQQQRIGIARALTLNPELIVCDEPVSALDVSIQSQILNLLEELQEEFKLTYLFIAHDLSVVHHISDRVAVMYLGKIMEIASFKEIYNNPLHIYTRSLLSSIPSTDPDMAQERFSLEGEIPSPVNPPKGCNLSTRCSHAQKICLQKNPELVEKGPEHYVACHILK